MSQFPFIIEAFHFTMTFTALHVKATRANIKQNVAQFEENKHELENQI